MPQLRSRALRAQLTKAAAGGPQPSVKHQRKQQRWSYGAKTAAATFFMGCCVPLMSLIFGQKASQGVPAGIFCHLPQAVCISSGDVGACDHVRRAAAHVSSTLFAHVVALVVIAGQYYENGQALCSITLGGSHLACVRCTPALRQLEHASALQRKRRSAFWSWAAMISPFPNRERSCI